jgi:soluble lytic murein transglycosylase
VRAGKVGIQRGAFAPEVAYPLVFVPDEAVRFVSPEIILGLSRQESEFNPRAYSRAGARGMMQLIPTTAQITARKEGLLYNRSALLDDPVYNMTIGSAHLSHLLERFDGSLIMTLAAYNAGAARVDRWITEYGDPRSSTVDPLDWVELIPFSETRNYVQRVLENVQVYHGRINDKPIPGRLYSDLERGGPRDRVASMKPPSIVLANAASSFAPQALPALPKRTEERARRYAQQMVETAKEPADQPAIGASPIAFNKTASAATAQPANKKKRNAKIVQPEEAPVAMTAKVETSAQSETAPAEISAEPEPAAPTPELTPRLQPRDPKPAPQPEQVKIAAVEDNAAPETPEPAQRETIAASSTTFVADGVSQERINKILARMPAPEPQPAAIEPDDSEIESCLASYDAADEEDNAADLNAGMLAALQGEDAEDEAVTADC